MHEAYAALPWLAELKEMVEAELSAYPGILEDRRPALQAELERLQGQIHGWTLSLGSPTLPLAVRSSLEREFEAAQQRVQEIEDELRTQTERRDAVTESVDPETVLEYVRRLSDVLTEECPTLGNLELSLHVERIDCYRDGQVEMRTCKLGSMPVALALLLDAHAAPPEGEAPRQRRGEVSRRRARLRVDRLDERADELLAAADMAADPDRFAGLPEEFFWIDTFVPTVEVRSWASDSATQVLERFEALQAEQGRAPSLSELARQFGVAKQTVKKALAIARGEAEAVTTRRPRRQAVSVKGNSALEAEILRLYDVERLQIKVIAKRIGCGKKAVSDALDRVYAAQGGMRPDARGRNRNAE